MQKIRESDFNLVAIDNSEAMIERLIERKAIVGGFGKQCRDCV